MRQRTYRVEIEVSEEALLDLDAAAKGAGFGCPSEFLVELTQRVSDGVRRPGSWERGWLQKVSWKLTDHVEPDADARWRNVPSVEFGAVVASHDVHVDEVM